MIAIAVYVSLLTGQVELDEKAVKLREELRRTLTNSSLMLGQVSSQKDVQRVYEQGFTSLTKIVDDATSWERLAKTLDQKAKFGLLRYEASVSMLNDSAKIEALTLSLLQSYRESTVLCTPIEELFFYRFSTAAAFPKIEETLGAAKNKEVQASAALARILRSLVGMDGDPNLLRTIGQQYAETKAGKRAQRIFDIRTKLALGQPMPELEMPIIGGTKLKISSLKGKVVLIDFWGFWSSTCNSERSELKDLAKNYSSKLQIVGVNTDDWNPSFLLTKFKTEGVSWPNHASGIPSGIVPLDFGVTEYPSKIIVDPQGIVRYLPGIGSWREVLDSLLK